MNDPTRFRIVGIDCAADPGNIAVASATPAGAQLTVDDLLFGEKGKASSRTKRLDRLATDIAKQISTEVPTLLALDAPLGWPVAMRRALAEGVAGSATGFPADAMDMFRRRTDHFVIRKTRKIPQSVGASLVASLTHTALRLIDMIEEKCKKHNISLASAPMARHDAFRRDVHLIEVYPALAGPRFLGSPSQRFESWSEVGDHLKKFREDGWSTIAKRLRERMQIECAGLPDGVENDLRRLRDHGLDAILCAWTAWCFLQGECVSPPTEEMEHLAPEGWIWFDRRTPALLGKARSKKRANAQ